MRFSLKTLSPRAVSLCIFPYWRIARMSKAWRRWNRLCRRGLVPVVVCMFAGGIWRAQIKSMSEVAPTILLLVVCLIAGFSMVFPLDKATKLDCSRCFLQDHTKDNELAALDGRRNDLNWLTPVFAEAELQSFLTVDACLFVETLPHYPKLHIFTSLRPLVVKPRHGSLVWRAPRGVWSKILWGLPCFALCQQVLGSSLLEVGQCFRCFDSYQWTLLEHGLHFNETYLKPETIFFWQQARVSVISTFTIRKPGT